MIPRWQRPWALPRALAYATPWAWMRLYIRAGDWLLFHLWDASRPVMWWLEDRAIELDAQVVADARSMSRWTRD